MDKNLAALLREDVRTIGCAFTNGGRIYTYVCDDPTIQVDDLVVVPAADVSRDGLITEAKVVRVARVDDELAITPNSDIEYKWIIAKVDLTRHLKSVELNEQIERAVAERYKTNMRAAFQREVLGQLGDKALPALTLDETKPRRATKKAA